MTRGKRSIGILVRTLSGGGAQRVMIRLADGLARKGFAVSIVTLSAQGVFASEINPHVRVVDLSGAGLMASFFQLLRLLKSEHFDAFISTESTGNTISILANRLIASRSKVIIREGLFPSIARRESRRFAIRSGYFLAPLLYRSADKIIALTDDIKADLVRNMRLSPDRIVTLPVNPVVSSSILRASRMAAPHPWFGEPEMPVILGVGRLAQQKDFPTLIKAYALVRAARPCRLVIIGEGSERANLEALIRVLGLADDVAFLGFVAQPYPYLASCDLFVLSSRYEGLPNVLIEALACGAPVVSTNCPSGPFDILKGGDIAPLVPVADHRAMATAIQGQLDRPHDRASYRARGLDFSVMRSATAYAGVIEEVLRCPPPTRGGLLHEPT